MVDAYGFRCGTAFDQRDAGVDAVSEDLAGIGFRMPELDGNVRLTLAPAALLTGFDVVVVDMHADELYLRSAPRVVALRPLGDAGLDAVGSAMFADRVVVDGAIGEVADLQAAGAGVFVGNSVVFETVVADRGADRVMHPDAGELEAFDLTFVDGEIMCAVDDDARIGALVFGEVSDEGEAGNGGVGGILRADRGFIDFRGGFGFARLLTGRPADDRLADACADKAHAGWEQRAFGFRIFSGGEAYRMGAGGRGLGGGGQRAKGGGRRQTVMRVISCRRNVAVCGASERWHQ